jgi:regulator of replication initiation timing
LIETFAKIIDMQELKLKQLYYEADTWKRSLAFMMDENIHLKNRLTEILKNGFEKDFLDRAEYFQSRFIKEDDRIGLIRDDVAEIDKLLIKEVFENEKTTKEVNRKLVRLRNNIVNAEIQFSELKSEFSNFLLEMFATIN